ncbi:15575_t:CDS:2, partial [Gigaspora rosea]
RLIWEEKTVEKEGSFKQQDLKFKSEVVENKMRYEKERQKVSGESNMIIRAKPSKTKEKNKAKQYTESAKVVQAKIGTTRRLDIPSSTDQKLDSHSICLNKNKRKIDDFLELKVKIHNINGVKNNSYRLQELVDFGTREKFNLLGIVETNIIVDKEIL